MHGGSGIKPVNQDEITAVLYKQNDRRVTKYYETKYDRLFVTSSVTKLEIQQKRELLHRGITEESIEYLHIHVKQILTFVHGKDSTSLFSV